MDDISDIDQITQCWRGKRSVGRTIESLIALLSDIRDELSSSTQDVSALQSSVSQAIVETNTAIASTAVPTANYALWFDNAII